MHINRDEKLRSETDNTTQCSSSRKESLKTCGCKNLWGAVVAGETPRHIQEFVGETHRALECTQTQPPGNQHQKGPVYLWVAGEVTESQLRAKQLALFPLRPLPHIQRHNPASRLPYPPSSDRLWQPRAWVFHTPHLSRESKSNQDLTLSLQLVLDHFRLHF